jgi:hypothetical protein
MGEGPLGQQPSRQIANIEHIEFRDAICNLAFPGATGIVSDAMNKSLI